MKVYLPNAARLQNFEGLLKQFDPADPQRLEFSMHKKWVSLHPAALAFTACVADYVTSCGGTHSGNVEQVPSLPYLQRMKLFDHVHLAPEKPIAEHEEFGRFIPITRVSSSTDLSNFIVNMIPLLHAAPKEVEPIRYVISEMGRNVLEHSRSQRGAFLAAQYYQDTRVLALGIADAGVGLRRSIQRSHRAANDVEALRLALKPGVTGTTSRLGGNEYNAGAGLFFVKSIACASRNYFVLYSGTSLFKLKPTPLTSEILLHADSTGDRHTLREGLPDWPGTVVGIDLSIDESISFSALMRLIRDAFSVDVKRSKKQRYKPRFT